ncbi:RNA 2',3'-cyclic phosphodiesterase [Mesobaculum littorinae]|uniref:RNA 2',3'-cyclic phosphodiesterase n=1 Tax=Mesobaculum littorinae TaxID=2486419 RepID=A0A438AJL2_9RHOB|nr:RNA 2',3'-cyclic phosphodiesterase [Mesobaculum littorinae]RVV98971.1 RNA 2',3'-cyclic phosphodiesterase [Mesobaculum littorinae]
MIRTFAALDLPAATRDRLRMLGEMLPLKRRVPPENLHLTLVFLGELDDPTLESAHDGFDALRHPAFDLRIEGLGLFGGDRPRAVYAGVAPSEALMRLQAGVARAARTAGVALATRRFVPHVTLARWQPRGPDLVRLEHAMAQMSGFATDPVEVTEFVLYRSDLGGGQARYTELCRYPLA